MAGRMLYIRALSPIHSGTGQSTGVIDLPVAREKITNWPYLPGSSVKGVLRDACDPQVAYDKNNLHPFYRLFGPPTDHAPDQAGAATFCDPHLLCLPLRSFFGTFAWITCPLALLRWLEDHRAAGSPLDLKIPTVTGEDQIVLAGDRTLLGQKGNKVYLEDIDLTGLDDPDKQSRARAIAETIAPAALEPLWKDSFINRFGVVSNDVFTSLTQTGTDIVARIRLDPEAKTVKKGGLWSEEALPTETILAGPVLLQGRVDNAADLWKVLTDELDRQPSPVHQVGGNASVGRGLVRFQLQSGEQA